MMEHKPLKYWTFGELRAECAEKRGCDGCYFYVDGKCEVKNIMTEGNMKNISSPFRWDLPELLTEQELDICRSVGAKWVTLDPEKYYHAYVKFWDNKPSLYEDGSGYHGDTGNAANLVGTVLANLFPSIHPGDCLAVYD